MGKNIPGHEDNSNVFWDKTKSPSLSLSEESSTKDKIQKSFRGYPGPVCLTNIFHKEELSEA